MVIINNAERMERYCEKYEIHSHFSNWELLEKELVRYSKGEFIVPYGERSDKLIILVSGSVKFSCIADNYEEYFFFNARNEGLFGEVEYVMDIPSITQSEVLEESECILIPIQRNRSLLDQDLKFQRFLTHVLAQKYNDMRRNYVDVESFGLEERFARYLLSRNEEELRDLKQVSAAIRCSYRQLLRIIKKFCENGYLERQEQKGKYRITDLEAIKHVIKKENESR